MKTFFERAFGGVHDLPVPAADTVRALVQAARAQGMPVLLHANSAEAQAFGLDTGVDILAHGLWNADEPGAGLTPALTKVLDGVVQRKVGWQPTLQVLHGLADLFEPEFLDDPRLALVLPRPLLEWYPSPEGQWFHDALLGDLAKEAPGVTRPNLGTGIARAAAATGYLAQHGGRLLFGSDTPSAPTYANPPGLNTWLEMADLAAAGLTPAQIFAAATLHNAAAFGLEREIGTVAVGKRANLLLLRADPRHSSAAYAGLVKVILDGEVLEPRELAAP